MMRRTTNVSKVILAIVIAGILFTAGCESLKQLIKKPTIEYKGMAIKGMTLFDGSFVFNFNVANPNPIGVPLDQMSYDVKIDGRDFIRGNLDKKCFLPGNGSANVELPVQLNYMDFFKTIADFTRKDQLEYDVSGFAVIYGFTIPFHAKGTFPVPKPPQVSLNHVEIRSMSFASASVVFVVDMVNNNAFPILMDGLDYQIKLGGNDLAGGTARAISPINQNGKTSINLPMNLSLMKIGQSAFRLLMGSSSDYEISGSMQFNVPKLGVKTFSYSKKGNVPVGK